jgi:hypothetical protein
MKVYWLISLGHYVGKRENLLLDASMNCKRVKKFLNRGCVRDFGCSGESMSSSIGNELKTIRLRGRDIKVVRVAIVKSRMNKRGSNSDISVVMKTASNSSNITDTRKRI